MASAMVPLNRALLSSYRLSAVTIPLSVTVWPQFVMQTLTGGSDSKSPVPVGRLGPLSNIMLLGTTQVSLLNGVSFRPTTLAGCTSVTDGQTDHAVVTYVAIGGITAFRDAA